MLLDEIGYHIDINSTAFTVGTNVYKGGFAVDSPDTAISISEYPGMAPSMRMGSSTPAYESPRFQITSRSTDYQTARNNAEDIYRMLVGIKNQTIKPSSGANGCWYLSVDALQSPFDLGFDENARRRIVCNFQADKYLST